MQKSAAFLMVTVLLLGLFLMGESRRNPAAAIDITYADWIAANSSRSGPKARVTLVEINDSTLAAEGRAWPWSPLEYTIFLKDALAFKPAVIAIEPVLDWPGRPPRGVSAQNMQQYRNGLHDYVLQAPKLILGAQLGAPEDPTVLPAKQPAPFLRKVKGDTGAIPRFNDLTAQAAEDYRLVALSGFTNVPDNQGPVTRKAPLVFNYGGEIVPSLALQALIQWFQLTPEDVTIEPGVAITLGKAAVIPIDIEGRMNIDLHSAFTRFGYDDLVLAFEELQNKRLPTIPADAIGGGILLFARTDKAADTLLLSSGGKVSPGELAALAIATVQNKAHSRRVSHMFDFAVIAFMAALSCFFHRFTRHGFLLLSFVTLLFYFFLGMSVYALSLVWLPLVLPVGLLLLVNFFSLFTPRETPAPVPAGTAPAPVPEK